MMLYLLLAQSKEGDDDLASIGCEVFTTLEAAKAAAQHNTDTARKLDGEDPFFIEWHELPPGQFRQWDAIGDGERLEIREIDDAHYAMTKGAFLFWTSRKDRRYGSYHQSAEAAEKAMIEIAREQLTECAGDEENGETLESEEELNAIPDDEIVYKWEEWFYPSRYEVISEKELAVIKNPPKKAE